MKKSPFIFLPVILVATILSCTQKTKSKVDGAWKVVESKMIKQDSVIKTSIPTESMVLFADSNYSFCWTSQQSTSESWQMSDSLKLDRMNQMLVNTGTFSINDSILTTKANFALNPFFVNGEATFRYAFNGDTLVLTGLSVNSSTNVPFPLYSSGGYVVNKLVRVNNK